MKKLEEELKGYSTSQINQILKGIDEMVPYIQYINKNCTPAQIRFYRSFIKENKEKFYIAQNEVKFLAEHFDKINSPEDFPVYCPKGWTEDFFEIAEKIGTRKTTEIFNTIEIRPSLKMLSYIKKYAPGENFCSAILNFKDEEIYKFFDEADITKGNLVLKKINESSNINEKQVSSICKLSEKIDLYLEEKEKSHLSDFEEIFNKINLKDSVVCNDYLYYHRDFEKFLELLKMEKPVLFYVLPNSSSENAVNVAKKYIDFILENEKIFTSTYGKDIFAFLETFMPEKAVLQKLSEKIKKIAFADVENIRCITHAYNDLKFYSDKEISKNLYLDYVSFVFEDDFSYDQKRELLKEIAKQMPDKCIASFVDSTYTPEQIEVLRNELISEKDIKNALNPKFTAEHMKHIIYYNAKGIVFENDGDYDKNYVTDKNKDYQAFLGLYDEIVGGAYRAEEKIRDVNTLVRINKKYGTNINVEEFSKNYIDYTILDDVLKYCKEKNIAPIEVLNENTSYKDLYKYRKNDKEER